MNNIEIYQRNTRNIKVTATDTAGGAYDLTGYTCKLLIAKNRGDSTPQLTVTADVDDIDGNEVIFSLTIDNTDMAAGNYSYEVVIDDSEERITIVQGKLSILEALPDELEGE